MGGKKKLSLKQIERSQDKKDTEDKDKKKKEKAGPPKERKASSVVTPDAKNEKTVAELKKMHVLTPFSVATAFQHSHKRSQRPPWINYSRTARRSTFQEITT